MCRPSNKSFDGFTLIELLVVIAVIAILAALLLPTLSTAKLKALQVVCLNNTRELAQMALIYQTEHGKGLPRKNDGIPTWSRTLDPNDPTDGGNTSPNVSICPMAKDVQPERHPQPGVWYGGQGNAAYCWIMFDSGEQTFLIGSYAANEWFERTSISRTAAVGLMDPLESANDGDTNNIGFLTTDSVLFPSQTPLFSDGRWDVSAPHRGDRPPGTGRPGWIGSPVVTGFIPTMSLVALARHGPQFPAQGQQDLNLFKPLPRTWGVNVSFEDGHAVLVKLPDLWTLTWNRTWVPESQPGVP